MLKLNYDKAKLWALMGPTMSFLGPGPAPRRALRDRSVGQSVASLRLLQILHDLHSLFQRSVCMGRRGPQGGLHFSNIGKSLALSVPSVRHRSNTPLGLNLLVFYSVFRDWTPQGPSNYSCFIVFSVIGDPNDLSGPP